MHTKVVVGAQVTAQPLHERRLTRSGQDAQRALAVTDDVGRVGGDVGELLTLLRVGPLRPPR